ncbi:VanZ family protein [Halalkalicoccus subterraneus]|uniref:VanZ family protein n=1 Tax=Halalkalicoccus subterraneus TaxID=2675002 RepID=UPI000EFD67E1|nr:VanZ family protein [Halalkalicoccus subterraneus]
MRRTNRWIAVAVVAAAILVVSMIPIPGSVPEEGGGIPTSLLFHFVGYAALAGTVGHAAFPAGGRLRALLTGVCGASVYGALIECLQYPVPYRSFSILDMATNAAGATLGAVVLLGALALSEHRR